MNFAFGLSIMKIVCVSIPLNTMRNIYVNGKSTEELVALIDRKYIARIKK